MKITEARGIEVHFYALPMGAVFWDGDGFYIKSFSPAGNCDVGVKLCTGVMVAIDGDVPVTHMPHATMNPYGVTDK